MEEGVLCHKLAENVQHDSIALEDVQKRREGKKVPNARHLHEYVNFYFNARNPMMYLRRNLYKETCVLSISADVLSLPGVVVSDMNAARDLCRFMEPFKALEILDFDMIYTKNWNVSDNSLKYKLQGAVCAEVLVPNSVAYNYIQSVHIADQSIEASLIELDFDKQIICDADMFFR
jgi:hypothetical protein